MKQTAIIKHGRVCIELISYDDDKTCLSDVVEAWQKKQPCYLVRGVLPACTFQRAARNSLVDSMIQGARL